MSRKIRSIIEEITNNRFGKLTIKNIQEVKSVSTKVMWVCECGREKQISVSSVIRGITETCGRCDEVPVKNGLLIGSFIYRGECTSVMSHSAKKDSYECECGNTKLIQTSKVFSGQKTCGECNVKEASWWVGRKFNRLRMESPQTISTRSIKKVNWVCNCGGVKSIRVDHVVRGSTVSCGDCWSSVYAWYTSNVTVLNSQCRLLPPGGPVQKGEILNEVKPFVVGCFSCGRDYKPRLSDIKRGRSLTCGCSSSRISSQNREIAAYVESLGFRTEFEFDLDGKKYDVCVPDKNLLVEMNGLKWHVGDKARARDVSKYETALAHGYSFISMFEDEWKTKQSIMKNIVRNRLGASPKGTRIRPKQCTIEQVPSCDLHDLYDRHHYIGKCLSKVNYKISYNGTTIGGASFRRPSRQTCAYDYEVSRMVMDPAYSMYGIWTKILQMFVLEFAPKTVVTYSDNRLFTGATYGKMGFRLDGDVSPDYYWCRGGVRHHKSGLRKPPGCEVTETVLRESEGYTRVWDLGKKRWVL